MDKRKYSMSKKLTLAALLLSTAVIINRFRIDLPIGGAPVLRLSFGGPFLRLIAILFGPIYGGVAAAAADVINFMISPNGSFIPVLTLVEFCKGFIMGFLWNSLCDIRYKRLQIAYVFFFVCIGALGFVNLLTPFYFTNSLYASLLSTLEKNIPYASIGLLLIAFAGIVSALIGYIFHIDKFFSDKYLKLLICVSVPLLIGTTVNTYILKMFLLLPDRSFIVLWIPRIIKEMIMVFFNVYLLIVLLNLQEQIDKSK